MQPRSSLALLLALLLARRCEGSLGDVQPAYRGCLRACVTTGCVSGACVPSCASQRPDDLGAAQRLMLWDCEARALPPLRQRRRLTAPARRRTAGTAACTPWRLSAAARRSSTTASGRFGALWACRRAGPRPLHPSRRV